MLSPASLRVCCLAVMAPALTKADRQADCLPVVLSESFCVPKTPDTYSLKERISENRLRCVYSSEYFHNKRKPFMRRACWRTQKSGPGFFSKYRTIADVSSKSLLYTNKVRTQKEAKYKSWLSTKATTAYAGKIKLKYTMNKNTSHVRNMGLAKANMSLGLQSLKKMKQFSKENQSSGPINVMEDSLNYSDSVDSPVQIEPLITDITECDVTPMDNDMAPCINDNGRTLNADTSNTVSDTIQENTVSKPVLEKESEPFLESAGADLIEAMDTSQTSVTLTEILSSTLENVESSEIISCISDTQCSFPSSSVTAPEPEIKESSIPLDNNSPVSDQSKSDIPAESNSVPLKISLPNQETKSVFNNFRDFKLHNCSGSPIMTSSIFSMFNSSKLFTNASKFSQPRDIQIKCPLLPDNRFGLKHVVPVRPEKNVCCMPSKQELDSLESVLADESASVKTTLASSTRLLQKQLCAHLKKQIASLVEHYQRKLQIPCQRPAKHASSKSHKDLSDLKAELLQSEDVKNMSTAALVSLVRKLESSGSQTRILPPKPSVLSSSPEAVETLSLNFDSEDCADIKLTSGILKSAVKNVLRVSDPYLTESSEDECDSESEEEDTVSDSDLTDSSPLWKYMTHRTKLGSRSTWLLARVHELDFRIKEYNERLNELTKVEGSVSFEEPAHQNSSSVSESNETSLQTSLKQVSAKNFPLPLNGFLDRSDMSQVVRSASDSCQLELDEMRNTESSVEVESCSRTRPLNMDAFRKRKVVIVPGLHVSNPKFSRLSTVNCNCNSLNDLAPCILCTGQYHSIQSVDPESMALRDRIAILDPYFHPSLSAEKDIPLSLHLDNILKIEAKYQTVRLPSPEPNAESEVPSGIKPKFSDLRSHRKLSRYARTLSAKYRNKHHRNSKHLRKHKLVFGKWRRLHNKHTLRARNRFRRHSIASRGSSPESPALSPLSIFDDGLGYENRKRRDDSQFDIDDVIIPCNSKSGRLVEIQYKEIMIPSWRNAVEGALTSEICDMDDTENISDAFLIKRHEVLEIEEKEKVKRTALGLNKRGRRNRCDSRADSSGANTPDPLTLYNNQDNVFQTPNFGGSNVFQTPNFGGSNVFQIPSFSGSGDPASPSSPPATPNSTTVSDDSQPPFGNGLASAARLEKKKVNPKRNIEEIATIRSMPDYDEVLPYELLQYPLPDEVYEELLAESEHNKEIVDLPSNTSSFPTSPISSSSSTSTVDDEDDDITDPEWTVVKPMRNGPEQALVLKFAKR